MGEVDAMQTITDSLAMPLNANTYNLCLVESCVQFIIVSFYMACQLSSAAGLN